MDIPKLQSKQRDITICKNSRSGLKRKIAKKHEYLEGESKKREFCNLQTLYCSLHHGVQERRLTNEGAQLWMFKKAKLKWGLQSANTCIATYPAICRSDNVSQLWLLKRFIIIIEVRTLWSVDTCIAAHPAICRVAGCHYTWEVNCSNIRGQRDMTIHGWSEVNRSKLNWERRGLQTPISQPTHPTICESSETSLYVPQWSELNWTDLNWTESAPICRHQYYSTPCNMKGQQGMTICGNLEVNWSNTREQQDTTIHGWTGVNWSKLRVPRSADACIAVHPEIHESGKDGITAHCNVQGVRGIAVVKSQGKQWIEMRLQHAPRCVRALRRHNCKDSEKE